MSRLKVLLLLVVTVFSTSVNAKRIDVLVVYDTFAFNRFSQDVQTLLISWEEQINTFYSSSNIDIQMRIVGIRHRQWSTTDSSEVLNRLTDDNKVKNWRNELGADFVIALHDTGYTVCGRAWLTIKASLAYSIVDPRCGPMTAAHELGHTMGLSHSRTQGDTTGVKYRYGLGYGVQNQFATIMAYPSAFNTSRIGQFSNGNRFNCRGLRCGVPIGQANEAHAVRAINNLKNTFASHRSTKVGNIDAPNNLALSATASASSTHCSGSGNNCYHVNRVNDGNINTALGGYYSWANRHPQSGSKWVRLDWNSDIQTNKVEIYTSQGYPIREYQLQYHNGSQWRTLVHQRNNTVLRRVHTFSEISTRRMRIVVLSGPSHQTIHGRINEIVVYRPAPPVARCSVAPGANGWFMFTDTSTPGSFPIVSWNWTFINGSPATGTGRGPHSINYGASSNAMAILEVRDSDGNTVQGMCSGFRF